MTSLHRPLLALFCGIIFMIGTAPAHSTVFTANATLSSPPVTVTGNNPLPVSFDFGQSFASITFAQFQLTFSGDLWDPDEIWFLDNVGGQENMSGQSQTGAKLNPSSPAFFTDLLDGTFSGELTTLDWFTTTSYGLASIALQIDATPVGVAEPASFALLAGGLVGIVRLRRRTDHRTKSASPLAVKQPACRA